MPAFPITRKYFKEATLTRDLFDFVIDKPVICGLIGLIAKN